MKPPCKHEYDLFSFKEMPIGTIKTTCCKCKSEITACWVTESELMKANAVDELLEMIKTLFCDPEGNPSFHGSAGDKKYFREVIAKTAGGEG